MKQLPTTQIPSNWVLDELYLDLKSDWGFKFILGKEENKHFTLSFINSLLPPFDQVQDIEFLPTEHIGSSIDARAAIFDILCYTNDGRKILIEMQKLPQYYFADRTLFYATWPIQSQAIKGSWDYKLNKVYVISVIGFELKSSTSHFENRHKILNLETQKVYTDSLEFITLELPKFKLLLQECRSDLDRWLWAFIHLNHVKDHEPHFIETTFKRLLEKADLLKFSKKTLDEYKMAIYNERNLKPFTDFIRDEGHAEGFTKGKAHGLAEGLAEGEEKGRFLEKKELAKKLLSEGLSKEKVAQLTGIDISDLG